MSSRTERPPRVAPFRSEAFAEDLQELLPAAPRHAAGAAWALPAASLLVLLALWLVG